jgi:rod shape-determining protein MreC
VREFFGSFKFKIFAVVACVLIGLMLRTSATGGLPTVTQKAVSIVISPFQKASAYVTDAFTGFIGDITSLGTLKTENERLKKQITELQTKMVDYDQLKSENEQLKGIVDLPDEGDSRKYVPAMVISRDPGQWFSAFTIDKGTLDGIQTDEPVITSEGLVGVVISTSLNTSVVSTILDPSVHVGSIVSQTGDTCITQGESDLVTEGEFELAYLAKSSSVTAGDIITTNGRGGIYPKNIKIGIVQELQLDVSGNSMNAICKPMVDPSTVKNVSVIISFSGKDTGTSSKAATSSAAGGK